MEKAKSTKNTAKNLKNLLTRRDNYGKINFAADEIDQAVNTAKKVEKRNKKVLDKRV